MAQLHTAKEKYGVSVAARIDPEMAHQISERAEKLGLSFAKMLSLLISRGFNPQEPIRVENREETKRLEEELENVIAALEDLQEADESNRTAIAQFIKVIANDEDDEIRYLNKFKTIRDGIRTE